MGSQDLQLRDWAGAAQASLTAVGCAEEEPALPEGARPAAAPGRDFAVTPSFRSSANSVGSFRCVWLRVPSYIQTTSYKSAFWKKYGKPPHLCDKPPFMEPQSLPSFAVVLGEKLSLSGTFLNLYEAVLNEMLCEIQPSR